MTASRPIGSPAFYCSFCNKSQYGVKRMIAAGYTDAAFICNECTDLCYDIVHDGEFFHRIKTRWEKMKYFHGAWLGEFWRRFPV